MAKPLGLEEYAQEKINTLYNKARARHVARRDDALARIRRVMWIKTPPYYDSEQYNKVRRWFDDWEMYLWKEHQQRTRGFDHSRRGRPKLPRR